jgi:hypothetical protein
VTYAAGDKPTAAQLNAMIARWAIKSGDESVNSGSTGTTLQNDDTLVVSVDANTTYKVDLHVLATQGGAGTVDLKVAWTFPTGCTLDLVVVGPHSAWPPAVATDLEVEWATWQNVTSSPSGTISFGTVNGTTFSYHARGTLRVGSTAGSLQLQWAQNSSSATNLTLKSGSSLVLTPLLT